MKAAVWYGRYDVRIKDVPEPKPGEGEVKIKIHWCGICGTDLHEYIAGPIFLPVEPHPLTGKKVPLIMGHEFSGEVAEVGKSVQGIEVGDIVVPWPGLTCGKCYWCKRGEPGLCQMLAARGLMVDGAFAEYVIVPSLTINKVPVGVPSDEAALTEPLAVGLHGLRKSGIKPGDNVVVVGAGTIGLSTIQAARISGARKVFAVEVLNARKELAMRLGADIVIDPTEANVLEEVQKETDGVGADIAFECVGIQETLNTTVDAIRRGGKAVILGVFEKPVEIGMTLAVAFEKQMIGSFGHDFEFPSVLSYLKDGRMQAKPLITDKIELDDIVEQGFKELINSKERHIKILVSPR